MHVLSSTKTIRNLFSLPFFTSICTKAVCINYISNMLLFSIFFSFFISRFFIPFLRGAMRCWRSELGAFAFDNILMERICFIFENSPTNMNVSLLLFLFSALTLLFFLDRFILEVDFVNHFSGFCFESFFLCWLSRRIVIKSVMRCEFELFLVFRSFQTFFCGLFALIY
jgi:hypothetical protein